MCTSINLGWHITLCIEFREGETHRLLSPTAIVLRCCSRVCVRWLKLFEFPQAISRSMLHYAHYATIATLTLTHKSIFHFSPFLVLSLFLITTLFACFTSLISIRFATQRIRNANFKLKLKFKYSLIYKIIITVVVVDCSHSRCR